METRAYAEISKLDPMFTEWVADDPRTVKVVANLMGSRPGTPDTEAMLLLSLMLNDYVAWRKYESSRGEREQIAGYILDAEREGVHDY